MENGSLKGPRSQHQLAEERVVAPVRTELRKAGVLSVVGGLIWPVQAGLLAWTVDSWVSKGGAIDESVTAATLFVLLGLVAAALDRMAGRHLFDAADRTIAREREQLIEREARNPSDVGSAAVATLTVQKLALLQPWITRYYVAIVRVAVLPFVFFAVSFCVSWTVGLVLLVAGPLIPVFMALVGMAAEDASRRQMHEMSSMNAMLMDRLSAMLDIRLLGATERAARDFETRANALRRKTMAVLRIAFLSSTVLELFSAIGVAMVAVFVGFTLLGEIGFGSWGTQLTLGEGLFLLLVAPQFFQPMRDLAAAWHDRAAGYAVVAELDALDASNRMAFVGSGEPVPPLAGDMSVELSAAAAALPGRSVTLPNLHIAAGQTLALTGPSGGGKTTTLAAIAGLVPLSAGRIEVCGHSLDAQTADAWRARLSMIPQRPHFSDESLATWLAPDGTDADRWRALEIAKAKQIVEGLPDGLATRLGVTGGGVSGGEARRLMIARALLGGRDLILADEPTADLDAESAGLIVEALRQLKREGRALIVATHDPTLSAAMDASVQVGT